MLVPGYVYGCVNALRHVLTQTRTNADLTCVIVWCVCGGVLCDTLPVLTGPLHAVRNGNMLAPHAVGTFSLL